MLTDIFAHRYLEQPIWTSFTEVERRLLNQAFAIVKDAIPYYTHDGKENEANKAKWKTLHDQLARELGLSDLSKRYFSYPSKTSFGEYQVTGMHTWDFVCDQFVNAPYNAQLEPDKFIKERISFVELGLRLRGEEITLANSNFPGVLAQAKMRDATKQSGFMLPGSSGDGVTAFNASINNAYNNQVNELNERFRRAKAPLTYHNGFIQVSMDEIIEKEIAKPFWELVSEPLWKNVDIDMKEALDRRDSNDKDPAIFAAKALESAIKIVSDTKGWTRGNENGAAHYIDNLVSKANGGFLGAWEGDILKDYFRKVRNTLGHGPGMEPMPELSLPQTDWAIETAMSWVRTLVRRI